MGLFTEEERSLEEQMGVSPVVSGKETTVKDEIYTNVESQ